MADEKCPPKQAPPQLRVSSYSLNDMSHNGHANVSQRTVSSSTSLLSTPSNNIRRVQQKINTGENPQHIARHISKPPQPRISGVASTAAASKKLLNLQQSKKAHSGLRPFVLRKPASLSKYDYSVFASAQRRPEGDDSAVHSGPFVKESQVRAWESAEKITSDLIFDHHSSLSADSELAMESSPAAGTPDTDHNDSIMGSECVASADAALSLLSSIPNFTKGELHVILENYEALRTCETKPDYYDIEEAEKKALWLYRQQQNVAQARAFGANQMLSGKRKIQVFHKKEFLRKLFGYSNNINVDYTTNNSSYSAYDNVANVQKAFHEDKEGILGLLEEEKAFEKDLKDTRQSFVDSFDDPLPASKPSAKSFDHPMHKSELLDLTSSWLTSTYERQSGLNGDCHESDDEPDDHPEILTYTLGLLKQRVKEAYADCHPSSCDP